MKALLYKDFLTAKKYLRMLFLMDLIFVVVGIVSASEPFFLVFPMAMSAAMVSSLVSYDERVHFDRFCDSMPVSRRTQVDEKYLVGLLCPLVLGLLCCVGVARHYAAGSAEFWGMLLLLPAAGLVPSALMLPPIFKLGMERGRIFYYVFYFFGLGLSAFGSGAVAEGSFSPNGTLFLLALAISLALYALSWRLSVRFYEGREL